MSALRAALVGLSAVVLTAACAAGQQAQTALEKPTVDGTEGHIGQISLVNVSLQSPPSSSYAAGANISMTVYIANASDAADKLTGVTSSSFSGGWSVVPTSSVSSVPSATPLPATSTSAANTATATPPVTINAGSAVGFGLTHIGTGNGVSKQALVLKGLASSAAPLAPGQTVQVTFTFANAGQTTLSVPVHLNSDEQAQTLGDSEAPQN